MFEQGTALALANSNEYRKKDDRRWRAGVQRKSCPLSQRKKNVGVQPDPCFLTQKPSCEDASSICTNGQCQS